MTQEVREVSTEAILRDKLDPRMWFVLQDAVRILIRGADADLETDWAAAEAAVRNAIKNGFLDFNARQNLVRLAP
jgi:hypothetical protein